LTFEVLMDCDLVFVVLVSQASCFVAQLLVDELQLINELDLCGTTLSDSVSLSSGLMDEGCCGPFISRLRTILCCKDSRWMEWIVVVQYVAVNPVTELARKLE
jgi:hypothetical protein